MKPREPKDGEYVRSVDRALYIIQFLNQENGVTANHMAMATQISRPTTYRMLETLRGLGFVRKDDEGRYWLEPQILSLSSGYCDDQDLARQLNPILRKFSESVPWPISVSTRAGNSMVIRASTDLDSPEAAQRRLAVGWSMPGLLNSAAGTVYLAFSDRATRNGLLDLLFEDINNPVSDTESRPDVENRLDSIAAAGFAIVEHSITWNWVDRTNAMGIPIYKDDRLFGALSIRYFRERVGNEEIIAEYLDTLREIAADVGKALQDIE